MGHVSRVHEVSRQQLGKQRPKMMIGGELFDLWTWFFTWRIVHSSKALVYDPLIRNDCVRIVPKLFQVTIVIVTNHLLFECWPLMRSCQEEGKIKDTTPCDHLEKILLDLLCLLAPHTGAHHGVGVEGVASSAVIRAGAFLTTRVDTPLALHQLRDSDHQHQECGHHHDVLDWRVHCQLGIIWAVADTGVPTFYQDIIRDSVFFRYLWETVSWRVLIILLIIHNTTSAIMHYLNCKTLWQKFHKF